eukprot:5320128-Prymnesium_polylepis.1
MEPSDACEDCAICLECPDTLALGCSHRFCRSCLEAHAQTKLAGPLWLRGPLLCAVCSSPVDPALVCCILKTDDADDQRVKLLTNPAPEAGPPVVANLDQSIAAQGAFRRHCRRQHAKLCPSCSATIIKDGGCDNMQCGVCQRRFSWHRAELACPCRGWHFTTESYTGVLRCPHSPPDLPLSSASWVQFRACQAIMTAAALVTLVPLVVPLTVLKRTSRAFSEKLKERRAERERALERLQTLVSRFGEGVHIAIG